MDTPNKELLQAQYMLDLRVYTNEDDEDCSICLDTPKTVVCIPCGHLCCCYGCFKKLPKRQCILCRERIENIKLSMLHSSLIKRCKEDMRVLEIFNIEIPYVQLRGITVFDALSEILELIHSHSNDKIVKAVVTAYLNSTEERINVLDLIGRCTLRHVVKYKVLTATLPELWLTHFITVYNDDIRSSIEVDDVKKLQQILRDTKGYEIFNVSFSDVGLLLHLAVKYDSYGCIALLLNAELELMVPEEDEEAGLYYSFTRAKNRNGRTPAAEMLRKMNTLSMEILLQFEILRLKFLLEKKIAYPGRYSTSSLSLPDEDGNTCFHSISTNNRDNSMVKLLCLHVERYVSASEATIILNSRNSKGQTPRETAERYGDIECRKLIEKIEKL